MLDDAELEVWTRRRENTARPYRVEVLSERRSEFGLSHVRERFRVLQSATCECDRCVKIRALIKEIDEAME